MAFAQVACTVRRTSPTAWEILNDAGHEPIGVTFIEIINQQFLRLHLAFTATKVHGSHVTLDETFASCDPVIRVGQSVGLEYIDIYLYRYASAVPVDPGRFSIVGANLWVSGLFSVEEV